MTHRSLPKDQFLAHSRILRNMKRHELLVNGLGKEIPGEIFRRSVVSECLCETSWRFAAPETMATKVEVSSLSLDEPEFSTQNKHMPVN